MPAVHYSTDYVYDGTKPGAYVEDHKPAPAGGSFGESKLADDRALLDSSADA